MVLRVSVTLSLAPVPASVTIYWESYVMSAGMSTGVCLKAFSAYLATAAAMVLVAISVTRYIRVQNILNRYNIYLMWYSAFLCVLF